MTLPTLISKETRTDIAGTYTAYIYADGHVETDPPGRPLSKEDLQRQRKAQVATDRAKRMIAAERAKFGVLGDSIPNQTLRDNATAVSSKIVLEPFHKFLHAVSEISDTATVPQTAGGHVDRLITTVPLGGKVVGDRARTRPEYSVPGSDSPPDPNLPAELQRVELR